jgi:hypothetical protein
MLRIKNLTRLLTAAIVVALVVGTIDIANAITGSIFTSTEDGTVVNNNLYGAKEDVYLNGGPQNPHGSGLPNGTYYFQVTNPNGATLLSTDSAVCRQLTVAGGVVAGAAGPCPHAEGDFNPANGSTPVHLFPFDPTPNPGGEYKVWLIAQTAGTSIDGSDDKVIHFDNNDAKTDNFKVNEEDCTPDCSLPEGSVISGFKFYDANVNGIFDGGEVGIQGWQVELFGAASNNTTTDVNGEYAFSNLDPGTYGVCEIIPEDAPVWVPTTPSVITGLEIPPDKEDNNFGNVCLGAGGGHTLGFWSNKNGEAKMKDNGSLNPELSLLNGLCLRNANGTDFNPGTNYGNFRNWLLSAKATNMAYMLSAQLAAMELNVEGGFVSGGSIVYAPGHGNTGLNNNFITITDLMAAANGALCADGFTPSGDPNRATQEILKDALDDANNNLNFVQATPCDVNYSNEEGSCAP